MEIWITAIAVMGTLAGASVSPIVSAIAKSGKRRAADNRRRSRAISKFGEALLRLASVPADAYSGSVNREARNKALASRIALVETLVPGEGRVDRYSEFSIAKVDSLQDVTSRFRLANHATRRLFEWAREERKASTLLPFTLDLSRPAEHSEIVELIRWEDQLDDTAILD